MTGASAKSVHWGGTTRGRTLFKSDSRFCVKFCGRSQPVIDYPVFITTKDKTSQVSLFSKWISIFIFFHNLAYTTNLCLPRYRRQKCLLVFRMVNFRYRVTTPEMPRHFIEQLLETKLSWTMNHSASGRNYRCNILSREYFGVSFIFCREDGD